MVGFQEINFWCPGKQLLGSTKSMAGAQEINCVHKSNGWGRVNQRLVSRNPMAGA